MPVQKKKDMAPSLGEPEVQLGGTRTRGQLQCNQRSGIRCMERLVGSQRKEELASPGSGWGFHRAGDIWAAPWETSGSVPGWEGAQEGHFRQRTEQKASCRRWKRLTSSAHNAQFITRPRFHPVSLGTKPFSDLTSFKTYNPNPAPDNPAQITSSPQEVCAAVLLSPVCPF